MSDYVNLEVQKRGHTAVIVLSNPPANTWTVESLTCLKRLVLDLEGDRDIYALVITGAGKKFFSAGADLKMFADGDKAQAREAARVVSNPPAVEGVCDLCGGELYQRPDDNEETVRTRLRVYAEETAPIIGYYAEHGLLRSVDAIGPLDEVTERILTILPKD